MLRSKGVEPTVVEYLKAVPSRDDLEKILVKLNAKPEAILRKGEKIFKEKFKGKTFHDHEWVEIMRENPKLIERPIVVRGNKAVIGRPPENVLELLS